MINIHDAIGQACTAVGIVPPKSYREGRWTKTDTLSGKNGKGDGRIIADGVRVTAHNWQTGQSSTVWLNGAQTDRKEVALRIRRDEHQRKERAQRAAEIASRMVAAARLSTHPYLISKGFREDKAIVLSADEVRAIGGAYLVPKDGLGAIIMPARIGDRLTSAQLIWEDGAKKFLAGGEISDACCRIARGVDTWLCEGYATGLSVRTALKGLKISATVLCCFSAANIVAVARHVRGRCFIAADNDKPMEQFDGLGTGEYYARLADRPYGMPPRVGDDFNDLHQTDGIFVVQRALTSVMARRRAA